MAALMVCSRFSAWSNTMEAGDSKTSSVTSSASDPALVVDLLPDLGLGVVQRGQAVHELHRGVPGGRHRLRVHLVGQQRVDAGVPLLGRLPHGQPHVGVQVVRARHGRRDLVGDRHPGTGGGGEAAGDVLHAGRGLQRPGSADAHVHAQQAAGHQQGVRGVVAAVAQVAVGHLGERLGGVVAHGEDVGQHLRGVPVVGEPVPHRHPGVGGQRLHLFLGVAAVLDAVEHPAEHPRGVLHRLLAAQLGVIRPDVGDVTALVVRRHLERRPGPCRGLLEDQRDAPPGQAARPAAGPLVRPQPPAEVDEVEKLFRAEVDLFEQAAPSQVHECSLVLGGQAALRNPRWPGRLVISMPGAACAHEDRDLRHRRVRWGRSCTAARRGPGRVRCPRS